MVAAARPAGQQVEKAVLVLGMRPIDWDRKGGGATTGEANGDGGGGATARPCGGGVAIGDGGDT